MTWVVFVIGGVIGCLIGAGIGSISLADVYESIRDGSRRRRKIKLCHKCGASTYNDPKSNVLSCCSVHGGRGIKMRKVEHVLVWIMWALVAILRFGGGECSSTEFAIMTVAVLIYGRATS